MVELLEELLRKLLASHPLNIRFDQLNAEHVDRIIEGRCYQAVHAIKAVLKDDSLSDADCVEKIVCLLKKMGVSCGTRHDLG